jgi:hypothetical protein
MIGGGSIGGHVDADNIAKLIEEGPMPLSALPKKLPVGRSGKRLHLSTIWRWASRGIRNGERAIRLETFSVGGDRFTSWPAVERFLAALNDDDGGDMPTTTRTSRKRAKQIANAEKKLSAMGV